MLNAVEVKAVCCGATSSVGRSPFVDVILKVGKRSSPWEKRCGVRECRRGEGAYRPGFDSMNTGFLQWFRTGDRVVVRLERSMHMLAMTRERPPHITT